MSKLYVDTETCGLHSLVVLIQYAVDDGPIVLYDVWHEPVDKTLRLLEDFCEYTVVGFNLAFDWFHLQKLYTIWRLLPGDWIPIEHVDQIAQLEPEGRDGPCLKPKAALDLFLHSRKGPCQSLMGRAPIRVRRVPAVLADALAAKLEEMVELDNIYFARSLDKDAPKWQVYDLHDRDGELRTGFKDVVLNFNPAGGLKFLAEFLMGLKPKYHYKDVEPPKAWFPCELGYAPFALAVSDAEQDWEVWEFDKKQQKPVLKGYAWPKNIHKFVEHWATREDAREYATDDIVFTRALDKHFEHPEPSDDDSVLACMVASVRWHGFKVDLDGIKELDAQMQAIIDESPINVNRPVEIRAYLEPYLDYNEYLKLEETTKKKLLESFAKLKIEESEECGKCLGEGCVRCNGSGYLDVGTHPVAPYAQRILDIRAAQKEQENYKKLLIAGRFHASFKVIGTLSSRMSGADGLNPQGIKATKNVRSKFPLAWEGMILAGGDFASFEVTLAEAVYNDPDLRRQLLSGKKLHALFGTELYPELTYEQLMLKENKEKYKNAKSGVFAMQYGGDWTTLVKNQGVDEERAKAAYENWGKRFPGIGRAQKRVEDMFCSMRQPGGVGTQVVWKEPADYIESFLGFRRYFTLENKICRALFELASKPPKEWRQAKVPVQRAKDGRIQSAHGAVASALYGAAFGIQGANMRAAANHEIQSPGGQITKNLERRIWDVQPHGAHDFLVAPLNIHDELMVVMNPAVATGVAEIVRDVIESYRPKVPLIEMAWVYPLETWYDKEVDDPAELSERGFTVTHCKPEVVHAADEDATYVTAA